MKALLDTNAVLWWLTDDARIREFIPMIGDPKNEIFFSSISAVEISIKSSLGKLTIPESYATSLLADGFTELPFTVADAQAVAQLPWHHRDPFDRMLIAQALTERLPVITTDRIFKRYGVDVLLTGAA